mmetsp:Transcript_15145/g.60827  ORF Transcript_15145/g.60827 Transcript_15145/m.60827 type:complete len:307 (-) Transcript_15145:498-1418(-)
MEDTVRRHARLVSFSTAGADDDALCGPSRRQRRLKTRDHPFLRQRVHGALLFNDGRALRDGRRIEFGVLVERLEAAVVGVHREHREGLLDLDAELVDAEHERRDGKRAEDDAARGDPRAEEDRGHEGEPAAEEARRVARVHEGHGRLLEAVAHAAEIGEGGDVLVDARLHLRRQPFAGELDGEQPAHLDGPVRRGEHGRRVLGANQRLELGFELLVDRLERLDVLLGVHRRAAETVRVQSEAKGDGEGREAPRALGVAEPVRLPREVARLVDDGPPDLARLPPAAVRRVGAERDEQTERRRRERQG